MIVPSDPRAEIERDLGVLVEAFAARDLDGFMQGYAEEPDVTYIAAGRTIRGHRSIREDYAATFFVGAPRALSLAVATVRMLCRARAVITVHVRLEPVGIGEEPFVAISSLVMARQRGRWRILHDHTG